MKKPVLLGDTGSEEDGRSCSGGSHENFYAPILALDVTSCLDLPFPSGIYNILLFMYKSMCHYNVENTICKTECVYHLNVKH